MHLFPIGKPDYNLPMNRSIAIVYATCTGHTEFVIDTLVEALLKEQPDLHISKQRAEVTKPEDLTKADILLLACGTWNTGNVEGQLNPHMHDLLMTRAAEADLTGKSAAAIGLGDERYHFTAKAAERLTDYLTSHHAAMLLPVLKIVNEPFDQTAKVLAWSKELLQKTTKMPVKMTASKKK